MKITTYYQTSILTRAAGILLFFLILLSTPLKASEDTVIIELNNESLTLAEYNKHFMFAVLLLAEQQGLDFDQQETSMIESLHRQYLNQRITEMVLLQEATKRNISPSRDQIEQHKIELYKLVGGPARLQEFAAKAGISTDEELHRIVAERQSVRSVTAMLQDEIVISPGDIVVLHHDIQEQLRVPEQTCIQQILVGSQGAADSLMGKLNNQSDFESVASEYTLASGQVNQDDNISCFAKERLLPGSEFEKAVFTTSVGEISGPVQSVLGYHIIKVVERKPAYTPGLNEVYAELEQELKHERLPARIADIVEQSGVASYPDRLSLIR